MLRHTIKQNKKDQLFVVLQVVFHLLHIVENNSNLYAKVIFAFPPYSFECYNYKILKMLKLCTFRSVTIKKKVDGNK
jgi:hypothetical protein